ncbi:MAG: hypothetical protein HY351_01145 [Candidatus Omnitrophica bacterium]|nr:hypothetical protein [Candidatus Omnitrophota bacterium]
MKNYGIGTVHGKPSPMAARTVAFKITIIPPQANLSRSNSFFGRPLGRVHGELFSTATALAADASSTIREEFDVPL